MVLKSIQLIVAPVVMVTACAILSGGILSRCANVNDRLRLMARERFDLLSAPLMHSKNADNRTAFDMTSERLSQIDRQIPLLLGHHRQIRQAIFALYGAATIFLLDMFIIATSVVLTSDFFAVAALFIFLIGVGVLLTSLVITVQEVSTSHRALYYEVMRIAELSTVGTTVTPGIMTSMLDFGQFETKTEQVG